MQAGHEKTLTALLPALAGANLIYGLGMLDLGITLSFSQLVADNEFAKMIKRAVQGIPVCDEDLAVDIIKEVGSQGDFLCQEHTIKRMRTIQSHSKLIDRNNRETWEQLGKKDMSERAIEEARSILENHKPEPLPPGVESQFKDIIAEAEEEAQKMAIRK